jgi:hypothetical protein
MRVSTAEQTIDHQLAHLKATGFATDEVRGEGGANDPADPSWGAGDGPLHA